MKNLYPSTLKAFKEKESLDFRITSLRLRLFPVIVMGLILCLGYFNLLTEDTIKTTLYILFFIFLLSFPYAFMEREQKHQKEIGSATFHYDRVEIDGINEKLFYKEVIELGTGEIRGENIFYLAGFLGPRYSAGQDSYMKFKSKEHQQKFHFRFETYKDQLMFKNIIYDQYYRGDLKLSTVYNGLNLDYEEIQNLKKHTT